MERRRLVAVVGATATGKTEVGAAIAMALDGEVVSADAYQVYRGLDVGTAKPSASLRARVRHHLVDALSPAEQLTLADYLELARAALQDIWARRKLPVLSGGSGQYVWAVIEGWEVPRVPPDGELRAELERFAAERGPAALHALLAEADPAAAARLDARNVRRVVRALEVVRRTGRPLAACRRRHPIEAEVLVIGLRCPRADLYRRIDARVDAMFESGLVEEVARLREANFGESRPLRSAIGYKEASAHLDGRLSLEEARQRTKAETHRLARNQGAWFKPDDPRVRWIDAGEDAAEEAIELARAWVKGSN
jgi:tRNA dimethylallyltransferase